MKISHVLTAVDNNPKYSRFVPIFIEAWKKTYPDIKVVIVFVGEMIPNDFEKYKENLVLFRPIPDLKTAYIAQTIRILYPCLIDTGDGVLITDMDMLPGKSNYFVRNVENISSDKFISYRGGCENQIYMCYNVASPSTWRSVFQVSNETQVVEFLKQAYNMKYDGLHGGEGWCSDQLILYQKVNAWEEFKDRFVCLHDSQTGFTRLDWFHHHYNHDKFVLLYKSFNFSDCHFYADMCPWSLETLNKMIDRL
jgi:hypothetical protein